MAFDLDELFDVCEDEINNLQGVRDALSAAGAKSKRGYVAPHKVGKKKVGRPVGSVSAMKGVKTAMKKAAKMPMKPAKKAAKKAAKRTLTEAGRKAISDAMKARWAARSKK